MLTQPEAFLAFENSEHHRVPLLSRNCGLCHTAPQHRAPGWTPTPCKERRTAWDRGKKLPRAWAVPPPPPAPERPPRAGTRAPRSRPRRCPSARHPASPRTPPRVPPLLPRVPPARSGAWSSRARARYCSLPRARCPPAGLLRTQRQGVGACWHHCALHAELNRRQPMFHIGR